MKVAIVGCGVVAASHLRILKRIKPDAEILLCDPDKDKCLAFAKQYRVSGVFTDFGDLLEAEHVNTVHIITPPSTHTALAEQALLAGAHILVEKPITETSAEYKRLADLAEKEKLILCGDYSTLGMPVVMKAVQLIRSGLLGRLLAVNCSFAGSAGGGMIQYKDPHHWAYRLPGGILQNMIDHPLSLILSVMDSVEDQYAFVNRRNILPFDCPDMLHLTLRNRYQVGSLTLSLGHGCNERRAQFILEGGSIMIDMGRQLFSFNRGSGPQNFVKKALSGISEGFAYAGGTVNNIFLAVLGKLTRDPGIARVIDNFYKAVETGEPLFVRHEVLISMTKLLEELWNEVNYQPVGSLMEVKI